MNYYIQGDAAKADKIRAAFEKLGYEKVNVIHIGDYANERLFFFTENGKVRSTLKDCGIANIIKTHPDYQELELPIETKSKFNVGNWLYHNTHGIHPILVIDYNETQGYKVECIHYTYHLQKNVVENEYHLWTIQDAKDGDVLALNGKPFIYSHNKYGKNYCYIDDCGQFRVNFNLVLEGNCVCPATKQERDLLFSKMRKVGYEWDEKKKELRKIQPHYDIANFKAGMPVLERSGIFLNAYLSENSANTIITLCAAYMETKQ